MKARRSPAILGFIWGLFGMLLSFAVVSVFASLQVVFVGFPLFAHSAETQYILIGAVFLLSVAGAVGSGLVSRYPKVGGAAILLSCCGVALLMFAPVLMQSFSFTPLEAFGVRMTPLALLIIDFTLIIFTAIGLTGGILAFIPAKTRRDEPIRTPLPAQTETAVPSAATPVAPAYVPPLVPASATEQSVVQATPAADISMMNLE